MAVDYFHRLLVSGKPAGVRAFRDAIYRAYPRTIAGETWTEIAPFSLAGLYELAPGARRVEPEIPDDPYDLSSACRSSGSVRSATSRLNYDRRRRTAPSTRRRARDTEIRGECHVSGKADEIPESMVIALLRAGCGRHANDHRASAPAASTPPRRCGSALDDNSRRTVQNVRRDSTAGPPGTGGRQIWRLKKR